MASVAEYGSCSKSVTLPASNWTPVIKKVLDVLSRKEVWLLLTLFALVLAAQDVEFRVPLVKLLPACNQILKYKLAPLSSPNAPVVSAGKVRVTLVQAVVTENVLDICLLLSASNNSQVYVAEAFPFT